MSYNWAQPSQEKHNKKYHIKEFNLSEEIFSNFWIHTPKDSKMVTNVILAQNVQEFIRLLKEWVDEGIIEDNVKENIK